MGSAIIEHINLSVSDPDRAAAMASALFGWTERWRGAAADGGLSIHVGNERSYIAYHGTPGTHRGGRFEKGAPFNHVGVEVDELGAVEARVLAHGLVPFGHGDYEPGKRFYFFDPDGIEYEIVSYSAPASEQDAAVSLEVM
ncbi:MAG: VOC family protein [Sphingomonas sp.]|uniref:VOC family protein n=1 Tax=Sphingomonas sp. TaxID=28214 RepID=UPI0025D932E8|nr:VOC family protein [Sphingomonas sp.]MBY0282847.1 VOC family protein [Sphingomonas sp.]